SQGGSIHEAKPAAHLAKLRPDLLPPLLHREFSLLRRRDDPIASPLYALQAHVLFFQKPVGQRVNLRQQVKSPPFILLRLQQAGRLRKPQRFLQFLVRDFVAVGVAPTEKLGGGIAPRWQQVDFTAHDSTSTANRPKRGR